LPAFRNRSLERKLKIRNVNHLRFSSHHSLESGLEVKRLDSRYNNFYGETTDLLGNTVPTLALNKELAAYKAGFFINEIWQLTARLATTLGLRADYFSYNENMHLAPRLAASYQLSARTSINGAVGLFYQNLPLMLISGNASNKDNRDPLARHYVLGVDHLVTESTRLTVEAYLKDYSHFPVDPQQPSLFPLDEELLIHQNPLTAQGKARSRGIEVMLQKKLAKDFYGLASASYFRSRYQAADSQWRNRRYDNRFTASVEGGYKPNRNWEFSLRWLYAGGPPHTPLDLEESRLLHHDVYDRDRVNQARYPDYHSMNLRFDKRFYFHSSSLVFYLSVWNVYNRKNLAMYFWNDAEQKQDEIYQWLILPIFGFEYEF
jgi:outer membrane receptor protein involved in Fe transport